MHRDHRRRYHVVPAEGVYPGDRISTDQKAIDAVEGDRRADADADWEAVEKEALLVRARTRTRPTTLRFGTSSGRMTVETDRKLLVVKDHTDGTAT